MPFMPKTFQLAFHIRFFKRFFTFWLFSLIFCCFCVLKRRALSGELESLPSAVRLQGTSLGARLEANWALNLASAAILARCWLCWLGWLTGSLAQRASISSGRWNGLLPNWNGLVAVDVVRQQLRISWKTALSWFGRVRGGKKCYQEPLLYGSFL